MAIRHFPEPELCSRLADGDEQAFREVFDRFHRKIFQFAFNFLKDNAQSEEIVQDTFLNFWLHRETLNPDQPIAPFLFTIARRVLIDTWRKAAASERFREQVRLFMDASNNATEELIFKNELEHVVQDVLSRLSDQQQEVFTLSRYEGLSYEEIAERMHISKNTVKYHLVNALKALRTHFGKHDVLYFFIFLFWSNR